MAGPHAPIIVLRHDDDAVAAFFSTYDALNHLGYGDEHHLGEDLSRADFFDGRGRRLEPVLGADGYVQDLRVESDVSHVEHIRKRVRNRSVHARDVLERELHKFVTADRSPLTLAEENLDFEIFSWRLANALRPDMSPNDPILKPTGVGTVDIRGWWHNTFSH